MANAGSLTVDLIAKTASFEAGLKRANASLGTLNKSVAGIQGVLARAQTALGGFGVGLGAAALVKFATDTVKAAGDLGELSQQLGVSTDLLQSLQFAAAQSSVSTEQLEAGISKLTRTVGEAAEGNKKAVETFNALKIGVLDAQGHIRSTGDILFDLADRLSGIKDPAARAAIEVDTLGKAGQRLDPILSQGRDGLSRYIEEARRAGAVLSGDTISGLDHVGDEFAALTIQVKAFVAAWTNEFIKSLKGAPSELDQFTGWLQEVADRLNAINAAAQSSGKSVHDFFANLGAPSAVTKDNPNPGLRPRTEEELGLNGGLLPRGLEGAGVLGSNAGALANLFGGGSAGGSHNPAVADDAKAAAEKIRAVIDALTLQRDNLARTAEQQELYNELARAGTTINTAAGQAIAGLVTQITAQSAALDATNELERLRVDALTQQDQALAASFQAQRQMADAAAQRQADIQQEIADNQSLIAALGQSTHAYQVQLEVIRERNAALQSGGAFDPAQATANAETLTGQGEQLQALQDQARTTQEMLDTLKSGIHQVGEEFVGAITGAQSWGDAAKHALLDVIGLVGKLVEQWASSALSFNIGGGAGGTGGGSILGSLFSGIGSLFGFAEGGRPPTDRPSLVGENGPEVWWPDNAGTILPNASLAGGGTGGISITPYYDFRGSSVSQSDVRRAVEEGNRKTYSAVFAAMNRGGPEARASGRRSKK